MLSRCDKRGTQKKDCGLNRIQSVFCQISVNSGTNRNPNLDESLISLIEPLGTICFYVFNARIL